MTKFNWRNRKRGWNGETRATRAIERAADRILNPKPPASRVEFESLRKPYRQRKHNASAETLITVGADCPWNSTPGVRQVHCFKSVAEAHAAGFASVK